MNTTASDGDAAAPSTYPCDRWRACSLRHLCGESQVAAAKEIANSVLDQVPGTFGKLVLLSSLCRCHGDGYHHAALDDVVPECLASLILQRNHKQLFSDWLELHLDEQWKEVGAYFAEPPTGQSTNDGAVKGSWEKLIPEGTRAPERALFLSDLEFVLGLVQD